MQNKKSDSFLSGDEYKEPANKLIMSKHEHDLFYEENNTINKIVRVKRFNLPNQGVKWKIFIDNKVVFVIEGTQISKKEILFLETVEGFNLMLSMAKTGIKSIEQVKEEIKKNIQIKNNATAIDK